MTALPAGAAAAEITVALDHADAAKLTAQLAAHGDDVLAAGRTRLVVAAVRALPTAVRTAQHNAMLGLALAVLGDRQGAHSALVEHENDTVPTSHGWRLAMLLHLAGEPAAARDVLARADSTQANPLDEAQAHNWAAAASWMLGDEPACAAHADAAQRAATLADVPAAWAAAHSASALRETLAGDRMANAWHWHRALDAARQAGDVLQEIRIRTNLGSHLLEEGRYAEAAPDLAENAALADRVGFAAFEALSRCNHAQCMLYLGRLDEAVRSFEAARAVWQRTGSRMIAYALNGLGDAYRERGDLVLAKAAYDEAVAVSGPNHPQALVPALTGLARVLAPDQPDLAWRLAAQAERAARTIELPGVQLTLGWLGLAAGDADKADAAGRAVAQEAMRRRDRAALAEALELQAMCAVDADTRGRQLLEAESVWHELGHVHAARRVAYAQHRFSGRLPTTPPWPGPPSGLGGSRVDTVRPHPAGLLAAVHALAGPRVEVCVLGKFEVRRDGRPVDEREWQSRKARELVRVLVARRGRAITREALAEILWPGEEPEQLANRLSVAMAIVRRVFDPARVRAANHYLRAENGVLALDLDNIHVDVEDFLREGSAALTRRADDPNDAAQRLRRIVDQYPGQALGEDVYADWAVSLRDETDAMYTAAARALADQLAERHPADALPHIVRLLEADPYDEPAHQQLIRTLNALGRYGQAKRAQQRYAARMTELGLTITPTPDLRPHVANTRPTDRVTPATAARNAS